MKVRATIPLLSLALLAACSSKEPHDAGPSASASASAKPPASATASAAPKASAAAPKDAFTPPKWLAAVPSKPVPGKPGDRVWAVTPFSGQEGTFFSVVEIDSVQGDSATTASLLRMAGKLQKDESFAPKRPRSPGALMTPAQNVEAAQIKKDTIVIAPVFGYRTTAARVVKLDGGVAEIKYVSGDKVMDEKTEYAVPLASGVAPFAYVAVKNGASYKEVLVAAVVDDQVFGVDDNGVLVRAPKAEVKPLDVAWKDRKKGDKVVAFDANGSVETTIEVVSVMKWVYTVKMNGAERRLPFYAVVDKF
jgi:hypothetical protein